MSREPSEIARLEGANTLGLAFVKTVMLLNGGAMLAILSFIGNAQHNSPIILDVGYVKISMWLFLAGITSMLLALIFSYSYTASHPDTDWHQFWDKWIILLNFVCGLVSVLCFVGGVSYVVMGVD